MVQLKQTSDRRPRVDEIFDYLYDEIGSMRLKPGDRISEADIAAKFGVSRQPVRDAFSRLESLDLLLIRPQRATEVRRFSSREIEKSRFVRAAVEKEVLDLAARRCDAAGAALLNDCIAAQRKVIADKNYEAFGDLDYAFHQALCRIARVDFAFDVISAEKAKVDRLCTLGLAKQDRMPQLLKDHEMIAEAVKAHDSSAAIAAGVLHLSRLDSTIALISADNSNYFEPEQD
ncbi:GntR family transcriptional regulator [uncultured Roseibium sp.]|uniref:GntR family transcriptional regulator n=1 Tax=uncultured Roseibium sp. TaxID=1936171 RepID=UPI002605D05D|nr:GntR family transcriptional regulator [uncultured Roseibium sp.]